MARLAGLPGAVLERAKQILWTLEQRDGTQVGNLRHGISSVPATKTSRPDSNQLALFAGAPDPLVEEVKRLDLDRMTPLEALQALADLQRRACHDKQPRSTPEEEGNA